jgi:hypothetical protein
MINYDFSMIYLIKTKKKYTHTRAQKLKFTIVIEEKRVLYFYMYICSACSCVLKKVVRFRLLQYKHIGILYLKTFTFKRYTYYTYIIYILYNTAVVHDTYTLQHTYTLYMYTVYIPITFVYYLDLYYYQ